MDLLPKKVPKIKSLAPVRNELPPSSPAPAGFYRRPAAAKKRRSWLLRPVLVVVNLLIIGSVSYAALIYTTDNAGYGVHSTTAKAVSSPLDSLSAADIAVNIARMAGLHETTAVTNYADTINAELATTVVASEVVQLPQIVTTNIKTMADSVEYIAVEGDTVSALAGRFGITSDSIKWSNDLANDTLQAGQKLFIPPMDGMLYTVRSGDTPERLAETYRTSASQIIVFNDAELTGLQPGARIFLPNAQKPAPVFSFFARYGSNGYDPGWCTYYAAGRSGAPTGWGHARTWAVNAAKTPGWMVSKVPVPGAIAQTTGIPGGGLGWSLGHVGIVEDVKEENGQYFIKYSDMNGLAGFNRVGRTPDWVPAHGLFQNFIYRVH